MIEKLPFIDEGVEKPNVAKLCHSPEGTDTPQYE